MLMIWLLACSLMFMNMKVWAQRMYQPTRYQGSIPKKEAARVISRSARSGLQFPVGR